MADGSVKETLHCANPDCAQPIEDDEIAVHEAGTDNYYHMGCDIVEPCCEVGSGGFERGE